MLEIDTCCIVQFPGNVIMSTIVLYRIIFRVMINASGFAIIWELPVLPLTSTCSVSEHGFTWIIFELPNLSMALQH